jgi:hypothetical protein
MTNWLQLPDDRRKLVIEQTAFKTGFGVIAIEKDWWVTLALKAVFQTQYAPHLVFKGGTSLSKGWGLIKRFSEDVDLAIDRSVLGFTDENPGRKKVTKLRKASAEFMGGAFLAALQVQIDKLGVTREQLKIWAEDITSSDADPRNIFLEYNTLFPSDEYLTNFVRIEIGARSLIEPFTRRPMTSLISDNFPATTFAAPAFEIPTVLPERTFLEKLMLLQEEFTKPVPRHYRMSRHLYDIHSIMDTEFGQRAVNDNELFTTINTHRKVFTAVKGVGYDGLTTGNINFIPPPSEIAKWKSDYQEMFTSMLGSGAPTFDVLMQRMNKLKE